LPEIMQAGGAVLREVGTTNRTRIADYEGAISDQTAMLLRVHPSNYRVVGFTEDVTIAELVKLAHRFKLLAVDDLGSGALFDLPNLGLPHEPSAKESVENGADLVCFSGDKLLGGPQCGVILGKKHLIDSLDADPLMRAFRVDKLTLAALEATLRAFLDPKEASRAVPTLKLLSISTEELAERAGRLSELLKGALPNEHFYVCSDVGFAGGGSLPAQEVPTVVVQWRPTDRSAAETAAALRCAEVPVIARIRDDAICFDLRTMEENDLDELVNAVTELAAESDDNFGGNSDDVSLPIL
jgi:L-seryl-tRNA(Ser) seleniumtransferase